MRLDERAEDVPGWEQLNALLLERNSRPNAPSWVDRQIYALFNRRIAVLVLDMCNFTEVSASLHAHPATSRPSTSR
jgi:hypothetical protein